MYNAMTVGYHYTVKTFVLHVHKCMFVHAHQVCLSRHRLIYLSLSLLVIFYLFNFFIQEIENMYRVSIKLKKDKSKFGRMKNVVQTRAVGECFHSFFEFSQTFTSVSMGAYHLARKSGNFGLKSNGKVIFRKFHSEIVEYLQRYSSFSVRNGTAEISLPFAKLSSFQSLISRKQ